MGAAFAPPEAVAAETRSATASAAHSAVWKAETSGPTSLAASTNKLLMRPFAATTFPLRSSTEETRGGEAEEEAEARDAAVGATEGRRAPNIASVKALLRRLNVRLAPRSATRYRRRGPTYAPLARCTASFAALSFSRDFASLAADADCSAAASAGRTAVAAAALAALRQPHKRLSKRGAAAEATCASSTAVSAAPNGRATAAADEMDGRPLLLLWPELPRLGALAPRFVRRSLIKASSSSSSSSSMCLLICFFRASLASAAAAAEAAASASDSSIAVFSTVKRPERAPNAPKTPICDAWRDCE